MKHAKVFLGTRACAGSTHHGLCAEPRITRCGDKTAFGDAVTGKSATAASVVISPCLGKVALAAYNDSYLRKAELVEELSHQVVYAAMLPSDCSKTPIPSLRKTRLRIEGSVPRILGLKKPTSAPAVAEAKTLNLKEPEQRGPESGAAQIKTHEPDHREQRTAELQIPAVKPPSQRRAEPKSGELKPEKPKRAATKTPRVKKVPPEPTALEMLTKAALEPERPARLEIPAHVAVKVIPTPRKRETKQTEAVVPPPPELPTTRPLKVIRKRREEAPKVFETIATSVPQAMLVGITALRDEGEPK